MRRARRVTGRVVVGYLARVLNSQGGTLHRTEKHDTRAQAVQAALAFGNRKYGENNFPALLRKRVLIIAPQAVYVADPDQVSLAL